MRVHIGHHREIVTKKRNSWCLVKFQIQFQKARIQSNSTVVMKDMPETWKQRGFLIDDIENFSIHVSSFYHVSIHLIDLYLNFILIEIPWKSHLIACFYIVILGVLGFLIYVIYNAMGKFSYQQAKWISLYKDVCFQYVHHFQFLCLYFRQKTVWCLTNWPEEQMISPKNWSNSSWSNNERKVLKNSSNPPVNYSLF